MGSSNLLYLYGLFCLSLTASILLAGISIPPAYRYFEKKDDAETARSKSLLAALILWMILQVLLCLLIFLLIP